MEKGLLDMAWKRSLVTLVGDVSAEYKGWKLIAMSQGYSSVEINTVEVELGCEEGDENG